MPTTQRLAWALTVIALLYSGVHFAQSGILFPLRQQNLEKFAEQTPALREHLRTGQPVHFDNAVQYGPVFFFVMHPLILGTHSDHELSNWLYSLQLVCIVASFLLMWATLWPFVHPRGRPLVTAWLAVVWLNFSPLYTILVLKSVETWELLLLSLALFAYVRAKTWLMALALAAAGLVKVLPLIFFYYLLMTNRRAFARACVALLALLLISHALYGPEMGLSYLPHVAKAAAGRSFGLTWHENLSLKAAVAKLFGHLKVPSEGRLIDFTIVLTDAQLKAATILGDIAVLIGLALLTWTWLRGAVRASETILWEWSLTAVAMLILSPNTTFEYATLVLGSISYALVRLVGSPPRVEADPRTWGYLGGAMFLLGVLLPRQVLNRLTFVNTLNRWTGYTHLTPSEAYQYYCFPLLGLLLLVAALWRLRPLVPRPAS